MDDATSPEAWLSLLGSFVDATTAAADFDHEFFRRWHAGGRDRKYPVPLEELLSDVFFALDDSWMNNAPGFSVSFESEDELRMWMHDRLATYEAAVIEVARLDDLLGES